MIHGIKENDRFKNTVANSHYASIVICSKGRHASLLKTVQALECFKNNERLLEILIIEETDAPQPLTGKSIRYFSIPERGLGLAFARNFGLQKVCGSIAVFIDDDIVPTSHWLNAMIDPFTDPEIYAVGGAVLPDLSDINTVGRCISFLGFPAGGMTRYIEANEKNRETNRISGGNCAFRADFAREIGGFDEFMRGAEDTDFIERVLRRKKKMLFVPNAFVFHKQRNSLKGVFQWFICRGIGDFSLKCKLTGPIRALVLPLRMNFTLKLLFFLLLLLILLFYFVPAGLIVLFLAPLLWNQILWHRIHHRLWKRPIDDMPDRSLEKIQNEICKKEVKRALFLVKFLMDLGDEIGTFIGFFRYIKNRFFLKPFILTFHYLDDHSHTIDSSFKKYYYPVAECENLFQILEAKGYFIVSLSAIIKRLKENYKVLFLDKILAVTFDDASENIYPHLVQLAKKKMYPITIFVPTNHTGQIMQWDPAINPTAGRVMNWTQIRTLKDLGMEIGSHTRSHCHLPTISKPWMEEEIKGSMIDLTSRFSEAASEEIVFSYPYGEVNPGIAAVVKAAGYLGAVANFPRNIRPNTDPFQIPRFSVLSGLSANDILRQSHSLWLRELLKDLRDWMKGIFFGIY